MSQTIEVMPTDHAWDIAAKVADVWYREACKPECLFGHFYVYGKPGSLVLFFDHDYPANPKPEGYDLLTSSLPRSATRDQVRNWLANQAGRWPVLPVTP